MSSALIRGVIAVLAAGAPFVAAPFAAMPAAAQTHALMHVSLRPDRPGAMASLHMIIRWEDSETAVPAPVRHVVLRLPEALGIEVPLLRSCSPAVLRARGPRACPPQSRLGGGSALVQVHAGSQTLSEHVALTLFLGPLAGLQPTFAIFARGVTPFERRTVLTGTAVPDSLPFGEDLVLSVPPIATLPLEPDASIAALSLSIGSPSRAHAHNRANAVLVPSRCPPGGLPFAVRSTFADGATDTAATFSPCP